MRHVKNTLNNHNAAESFFKANSSLASQEMQHRIHKSPQIVRIVSDITPLHALPLYRFTISFNIILPSTPISSKWSFFQTVPRKSCMRFTSLRTCHMPCKSQFTKNKLQGTKGSESRGFVCDFISLCGYCR